ncbi:hypothetical protein UA08_09422 [Talaromyces atroroseus]|uniref:Uncharacterized protein n=1 Tax=Talaromyces atroroseus TaxID=1441469 RepID=A0A1Q5Q6N4_TALAT|nr:hypothetical protein UA08_09422 [Talaromyces atroroseus]OKL55351.1 hypothetical protein UA08_09422 [Talaromyces atroroseus]
MDDIVMTDPQPQPCFMLEVLGDTDERSTLNNGNEPGNPLLIIEGTYDLMLKIEVDNFPYKYPAHHLKIQDAGISTNYKLVYSPGTHHKMCVIFKSDDMPEKEPRAEFGTLDDETLHLGQHKFLPGRLHIMIVGNLDLDLVPNEEGSDGGSSVYEGRNTPVFLEYWLRVLDKPNTNE